MRTLICLSLVIFLFSTTGAVSADFEKGLDAFLKEDYATALNEFLPLAEQGHAEAQVTLSVMYLYGQGVPQDNKTAVKWATLAAEQELAGAQYGLGDMYLKGEGVPQDVKTAVKWFRLAAEQGYAQAQLNLAVLYAVGDGVPQDYVYAHMWNNLAASNGLERGVWGREMIEILMTPADISAAQQLARECVQKNYKGC